MTNVISFTTELDLIRVKSDIKYVVSHNYEKIKVDSYDPLPLEKTMTFHNVTKVINSLFNKNKNNYYYNIFLKKASFELPKNYVLV